MKDKDDVGELKMEIQNRGMTRSGEAVDYLPMSLEEHNPESLAGLIYESSP